MDLAALAKQAARIGMGIAGTALEDVTLNLGRGGAYDPATDTTAAGGTHVDCKALPFKPRNQQGRDDVSGNTECLQIEAAALPGGTLITEEDTVTRYGDQVWQITGVQFPSKALWILDVRH